MDIISGFSLLQRPVTQINKKLNVREPHLDRQHNRGLGLNFDIIMHKTHREREKYIDIL